MRRIALRTIDRNSRINNQYGRFEFRVLKQGKNYTIPVPITAYGNIALEILTHDKLNGANNRNGVPCMELTMDDQLVFQQNLQRFKFSDTRSILIHTDYETAMTKGQRFVKMYIDNGNELPFYETNESQGLMTISPDSLHKVNISLWDIYNNNSQLHFEIKGEEPAKQLQLPDYRDATELKHRLSRNNLVVKAPVLDQEVCAYVFSNRMKYQLDAAYVVNKTAIFLWDMDQGLPDSLQYLDQSVAFDYKAVMPGASAFNFYGERIKLKVPAKSLFDTVFLTYQHQVDTSRGEEYFTLCQDIYPVRRNFTVSVKPKLSILIESGPQFMRLIKAEILPTPVVNGKERKLSLKPVTGENILY